MNERIRLSRKGRKGRSAGFTLMELMIVITIILILMAMAVGRYDKAVLRAREAVLHDDLKTMRVAIDHYTLDKQAAPQSLEDLKSAGYLHEVPIDPITQAKDWVPSFGDTVMSPDQTSTGIDDVHSASDKISLEGTPYNQW